MPVGDYVSYVISPGSMINLVKTMPVGADVHPHPHIWIGFIGLQKHLQFLNCQISN